MKYLILILLISLYACSETENRGELKAKLRVTVYSSKEHDGQSLLLLTTIIENKTDKNIFLIKSPPWYPQFLKKNTNEGDVRIPNPELTSRVMQACVNSDNYLKRIIFKVPQKKIIVDSIAMLNKDIITRNYNNFGDKFKSQLLVLKKGEKLELDNTPIYDVDDKIKEYEFLIKGGSELDRRNKLGEDIKMPAQILDYFFWDGEIKLNAGTVEVVFKEI